MNGRRAQKRFVFVSALLALAMLAVTASIILTLLEAAGL